MKNGKKGMSEGLMIVVGIILTIIMLGIFFSFTSYTSVKANERSAVITTRKLASNIDDVCLSSTPGYYKTMVITLPQGGMLKGLAGKLLRTLASFQILSKGDPDFLIYYDSFPQIEDLDWLLLVRGSVLPFKLNYTGGTVSFPNHKEIFPTLFYNKTKGYVLVYNIVPYNSTEGKWIRKGIYRYNTSSFDINVKTMRKYQVCGNHSLCLRTNDFLYVYPLKCTEPIELDRGNGAGSSWLKKLWELNSLTFGNTSPSFYLASPCKITIKIVKGKCKFAENETVPIYQYDQGAYKKIGEQTIYQKSAELSLIEKNPEPDSNEVDCIRVIPQTAADGFCYASPNLIASLLYGTYNFQDNTGDMWWISKETSDIIEERNDVENYILEHGIGRFRKIFFTWPFHPVN